MRRLEHDENGVDVEPRAIRRQDQIAAAELDDSIAHARNLRRSR
jgi:hypothetical protein